MASSYYYPHYDHQGSVVMITDQNGNIVGQRKYNAFGKIISQTGDWPLPFGYKSWQEIGDGLLMTPSGRIYCPDLGRFLQSDPLPKIAARGGEKGIYEMSALNLAKNFPNGEIDGKNQYLLVDNNPLNRHDPTGLQEEPNKNFAWENLWHLASYLKMTSMGMNVAKPPGEIYDFGLGYESRSVKDLLTLSEVTRIGLAEQGYREASEHFSHWVHGTGKPPKLSKNFLKEALNWKGQLKKIREEAQKRCTSKPRTLHVIETQPKTNSAEDMKILANKTPAEVNKMRASYYVIGTTNFYSTIVANSKDNTVDIYFEFEDKYNFHRLVDASIPIKGYNIRIPDDVWLRLKEKSKGKYGHAYTRKTDWWERGLPCQCPPDTPNVEYQPNKSSMAEFGSW